MDLSMRDCARLLGMQEAAVRRAIKAGDLSSLRVQDEPRVGRVDLLEWAMRAGVRVLPELFAAGDAGFSALGPAYAKGGLHDVGDVPWSEALGLLGLGAQDTDAIRSRAGRSFQVDDRGVALPRSRAPFVAGLEAPALHVLRRSSPAPLPDAEAGLQAWLLCAVVSPTIRGHLAVLARLAWLVADDAFVDLFRGPVSPERVVAALEEVPSS
jgi:hypothetical protein